ncbi:hypothetical protein LPMP_322010 [Leishmania panamensis]|uniref:Uncharacterized protein n=1 Tax=Leishmania panamensis TaxID=5679 RepID=A0A088S0M3_LEIPA|nr:hypothetical protein LPMP_322010 [Leishmania panamensis]AIO01085.1 hypothetical protein LPMP_322010 [Leishmania panamensis]
MAIIAQSFSDHYAELVTRVPTYTELLLHVQRREVGERKALEERCRMAFQDVLHVAAVMIADNKALARGGALARRNRFELTLYKKETSVWFEAVPPRQVALPTGRPSRAFPYAAFAELQQEERELRQWGYGVERRLREHIEEVCSRTWFFLNLLTDTMARETLSRQRLEYEEDEVFTSVKQRFFRAVPADYYRHLVITRYGPTTPAVEPVRDLGFEEIEEDARAMLMAEEEASRTSVFQYLQGVYDMQLFALNHCEVISRYELEEEERNTLFPLVAQCCREDFGILFYYVPALALHFSSSQPCMRALCLAQLQEAPRRTAAVKARFSWVPAHTLAGVDSDLDDQAARDEMDEGMEVGAEVTDDDTGGYDDSINSPSPPLERMVTAPGTSSVVFEPEIGTSEASGLETLQEKLEMATPPTAEDVVVPCADEEPTPVTVVSVTLGANDAPQHVPYAYTTEEVIMPVLYAYEKMEAQFPVTYTYEEAQAVPEDAFTAASSHESSTCILTPQPPQCAIYTNFEVFPGDPFAWSPQNGKKS